jgi:hypothetical protein
VALRDGATPSLDALGILDGGCATISTPFDVASGVMGGLRKTSASSELGTWRAALVVPHRGRQPRPCRLPPCSPCNRLLAACLPSTHADSRTSFPDQIPGHEQAVFQPGDPLTCLTLQRSAPPCPSSAATIRSLCSQRAALLEPPDAKSSPPKLYCHAPLQAPGQTAARWMPPISPRLPCVAPALALAPPLASPHLSARAVALPAPAA